MEEKRLKEIMEKYAKNISDYNYTTDIRKLRAGSYIKYIKKDLYGRMRYGIMVKRKGDSILLKNGLRMWNISFITNYIFNKKGYISLENYLRQLGEILKDG